MASKDSDGGLGAMASDAARSARDAVGQTADAIGTAARTAGTAAAETVTDLGARAARTARHAGAAAIEHAPELAARVEDVAADATDSVAAWVKRNPLTAVTGAFAAGALFMMMCRR